VSAAQICTESRQKKEEEDTCLLEEEEAAIKVTGGAMNKYVHIQFVFSFLCVKISAFFSKANEKETKKRKTEQKNK
jgi:hypothetical protein